MEWAWRILADLRAKRARAMLAGGLRGAGGSLKAESGGNQILREAPLQIRQQH